MSSANLVPMNRVTCAAAGISAALALAACGGGSTTVSHTGSVPTLPTPTLSQTTTTPPPTAGATLTQITPPAGPGACVAADLSPAFLGSNGATGHVVLSFALRNRSSAKCHTYGFPGVQFFGPTGTALTTNVKRVTHDFLGSAPEVAVVLAPGQEASFRVITTDVPTVGAVCAKVASVQIIAPDDTAPMRVAIPGIVSCAQSTVSPLQSGTGAVPGV